MKEKYSINSIWTLRNIAFDLKNLVDQTKLEEAIKQNDFKVFKNISSKYPKDRNLKIIEYLMKKDSFGI